MRKRICLFIFLVSIVNMKTYAEPDDLGVWSSFLTKYDFTSKIYGSTLLEFRSKENSQRMDCFISRQYLGYKWCSWLKTDVAYDFIVTPSTVHNRLLLSVTGTLKEGHFTFSLRERYVYDYKVAASKGENILRSKASISYNIPHTKISPYVAEEMFTWKHWMKTRHYIDTKLSMDKHSTLDFFYMYYTKQDKKFQQHLLGLGYILKI